MEQKYSLVAFFLKIVSFCLNILELKGRCCKMLARGYCGIETPQRGNHNAFHREINLEQLSILQYDSNQVKHIEEEMTITSIKIPLDSNGNWKDIDIWKIRSVYVH